MYLIWIVYRVYDSLISHSLEFATNSSSAFDESRHACAAATPSASPQNDMRRMKCFSPPGNVARYIDNIKLRLMAVARAVMFFNNIVRECDVVVCARTPQYAIRKYRT